MLELAVVMVSSAMFVAAPLCSRALVSLRAAVLVPRSLLTVPLMPTGAMALVRAAGARFPNGLVGPCALSCACSV
eukprot:4181094-Pyramimonas_sp.AAC.1